MQRLKYTYEREGEFFVGHLDKYPEHPTQGYSLQELETNLLDIYSLIRDGTLEAKKHGYVAIV
jgi:hypothetical protein